MASVIAFGLAAFYGWWMNRHFGHNVVPANDAEVIAGGISLLLLMAALLIHVVESRKPE